MIKVILTDNIVCPRYYLNYYYYEYCFKHRLFLLHVVIIIRYLLAFLIKILSATFKIKTLIKIKLGFIDRISKHPVYEYDENYLYHLSTQQRLNMLELKGS